jgi:hypothetical protein
VRRLGAQEVSASGTETKRRPRWRLICHK